MVNFFMLHQVGMFFLLLGVLCVSVALNAQETQEMLISSTLALSTLIYCEESYFITRDHKHGLPNFAPILSLTNPVGLVVLNDDLQAIVIVFRGMQTVSDYVTNSHHLTRFSSEEDCKACEINEQLQNDVRQANSVFVETLDKVLDTFPNYRIIVTGHSVGGALATVISAHLVDVGFSHVSLITFGAPRVGNTRFMTFLESRLDSITSVSHKADPVPSLPQNAQYAPLTGSIMDYPHTTMDTDDHMHYYGQYLQCNAEDHREFHPVYGHLTSRHNHHHYVMMLSTEELNKIIRIFPPAYRIDFEFAMPMTHTSGAEITTAGLTKKTGSSVDVNAAGDREEEDEEQRIWPPVIHIPIKFGGHSSFAFGISLEPDVPPVADGIAAKTTQDLQIMRRREMPTVVAPLTLSAASMDVGTPETTVTLSSETQKRNELWPPSGLAITAMALLSFLCIGLLCMYTSRFWYHHWVQAKEAVSSERKGGSGAASAVQRRYDPVGGEDVDGHGHGDGTSSGDGGGGSGMKGKEQKSLSGHSNSSGSRRQPVNGDESDALSAAADSTANYGTYVSDGINNASGQGTRTKEDKSTASVDEASATTWRYSNILGYALRKFGQKESSSDESSPSSSRESDNTGGGDCPC